MSIAESCNRYYSPTPTITCKLPEALAAQLTAMAREERRSKSAVLREALEARLKVRKRQQYRLRSRWWHICVELCRENRKTWQPTRSICAALANKVRVLLDTGPLVAFLTTRDVSHPWAVSKFAELPAPFLTCEPVLVETFFLCQGSHQGSRLFFEVLASGLLHVDFSVAAEQPALARLVHKYRGLPMSLTDACLVRMAEQHPGAAVFTLDSHFRVYQKNGRQTVPVIMP